MSLPLDGSLFGSDGSFEDARAFEIPGDGGDPNRAEGDAAPDVSRDGGEQDASSATDASVDPGGLLLRYDFSGTGTLVMDRVGTHHGQIRGGAALDGSGALTFDGVDDFVDMPNGLISGLQSVTVMAWVSWTGGPCWQRVFDFGSSSGGEGNSGNATSAFSLSPASCPSYIVTGLFESAGGLHAVDGHALSVGALTQVALSFDGARGALTLFVNGAVAAESTVPYPLSDVDDVNNWIGRSQWIQDNYLWGRVDEFRIYGGALTSEEVAALHTRGPDAP